MVRVVHTAIPDFESMCGRGAAPDRSENSINDINVLAFYHLIRWNLKFWGLRNDPAILPAESFAADTLSGLSLGYRSSCQRHIAVARGT